MYHDYGRKKEDKKKYADDRCRCCADGCLFDFTGMLNSCDLRQVVWGYKVVGGK